MTGIRWWIGVKVDHLYPDCPSRARGEASLRAVGWWDISGHDMDPDSTDLCGMCRHRYNRTERTTP